MDIMKFLRASMKKELSDQLHSTGQQEKVREGNLEIPETDCVFTNNIDSEVCLQILLAKG